jgi:hypothetical protein
VPRNRIRVAHERRDDRLKTVVYRQLAEMTKAQAAGSATLHLAKEAMLYER